MFCMCVYVCFLFARKKCQTKGICSSSKYFFRKYMFLLVEKQKKKKANRLRITYN